MRQFLDDLTPGNAVPALGIALLYIIVMSLVREPYRQRVSAIILAGAGAAYLGGGLGPVEIAFCVIMTVIAYQGLRRYVFIGIGWLLHTAWDVVHHLYAEPIIPFAPMSSFGCAVCDLALGVWYLAGAPSVFDRLRSPRPAARVDG